MATIMLFRSREESMLKQPAARPQSISVSANYKILNFEPYRTQSHAIPVIRYEYSNSLYTIISIQCNKVHSKTEKVHIVQQFVAILFIGRI